jgi:hypothetical protein
MDTKVFGPLYETLMGDTDRQDDIRYIHRKKDWEIIIK